jgi:hypothetical protein
MSQTGATLQVRHCSRAQFPHNQDPKRAFLDRAVTALAPMLSEVAAHRAFANLDAALPSLQELRKLLDDKRNIDANRKTSQS